MTTLAEQGLAAALGELHRAAGALERVTLDYRAAADQTFRFDCTEYAANLEGGASHQDVALSYVFKN